MGVSELYVQHHRHAGGYEKMDDKTFFDHRGWCDINVDDEMIFSHRTTAYTKENFTEGLHSHSYYELLIYVSGDVEYISEDIRIRPSAYTAVWFPPSRMHTARLLSASEYERYVFYFSEDFFSYGTDVTPIVDFMLSGAAITLNKDKLNEFMDVIKKVENAACSHKPYSRLLLKSFILQIFDILSCSEVVSHKGDSCNGAMAKIKQYVDKEYATLKSVSEIAEKFYYSREHLSRTFKQYFNISISDYISKRRVTESMSLLPYMSVAAVAYTVGYKSQSSYITAFKRYVGCLPSEYKARMLAADGR